MVKLYQDGNGRYKARKRLPDDVREEYGRLHDARHEAKFTSSPGATAAEAKRQFNDWQAEVEGRIAAIRAQRSGEGVSLTPRQTRALAGEWYDWFIARHPQSDTETWEHLRDRVREALVGAVGEKRWEQAERPDEFWRDDEKVREALRPVLADVGETAQFLAMKAAVLNGETRDRFLDCLYEDLDEALKRLIRMSKGDYSSDTYRERFPKFEGPDNGETPVQLFERWVVARNPKASSVESWRYVFRAMSEHFEDRSAASITSDEAQAWVTGLVTTERNARTVRNTWIAASNRIFRWALKNKLVSQNPFEEVHVDVSKRTKTRSTQAFHVDEYQSILKASLEISDTGKPFDAAKRWVPWICAYTGARAGEITQMRKCDVLQRDGIWVIKITPEAGTTKTNDTREVPLHEHLIEQGFLKFIEGHKGGPLFYKPDPSADDDNPLTRKKPRAAQTRQRVATWVRGLGVADPALQPTHAWRHTFKQLANRHGVSDRVSDAITGHAPPTVGRSYGAADLEDMALGMKKFPRYVLE